MHTFRWWRRRLVPFCRSMPLVFLGLEPSTATTCFSRVVPERARIATRASPRPVSCFFTCPSAKPGGQRRRRRRTGLGRRGGEPAPDGQRLRRGPPHRLRRPPCRAPAAAPGGAVAWRHVEGLDVLLRLCAPAWRNNWHSALTQRSIRALSLYLSGSMVLTMGRRSRRCKRSVAHLCTGPQRDISDLSVTFRHT